MRALGQVSDALWEELEPLIPRRQRLFRYPGRKRLDDRACLEGIIFVLKTGMAWQMLPTRLGYGSGSTCWRRVHAWTQLGVWPELRLQHFYFIESDGYAQLLDSVTADLER